MATFDAPSTEGPGKAQNESPEAREARISKTIQDEEITKGSRVSVVLTIRKGLPITYDVAKVSLPEKIIWLFHKDLRTKPVPYKFGHIESIKKL